MILALMVALVAVALASVTASAELLRSVDMLRSDVTPYLLSSTGADVDHS